MHDRMETYAKKLDDVNTMTIEEKIQIKRYLDSVSELLENGI